MSGRSEHQKSVPLSVLLKRELANEKIEKPDMVVVYGHASENKKGEDFILLKTECQRVVADGVSTYSVFGVCFFLNKLNKSCFFIYLFWFLNSHVMDCIVIDQQIFMRLGGFKSQCVFMSYDFGMA